MPLQFVLLESLESNSLYAKMLQVRGIKQGCHI